MSGSPRASASATRSRRKQRDAAAGRGRAHGAELAVAGRHGGAGSRRGAVIAHRHGAGARGAAVLHARHHFLADIAAFGEIDAAELVHVGFVRKGVAVAEIGAALRHAERNAVRLVFARLDEASAPSSAAAAAARCGGSITRKPERRQARIGIAKADPVRAAARCAVPGREHAEDFGQILDDDLGAQFVEIELVDERRRQARAAHREKSRRRPSPALRRR